MKFRNIFKALIFIIFLMIGVSGCRMENTESKNVNKSQSEVILNKRQKEILEAEGLPTDYSKLNYNQKNAIVAIEEMLQYLENKYGESFNYHGYVEKGVLEKEQLYAYPSSSTYIKDGCSVTKEEIDGKVTYTDDYINVLLREPYNKYISDYVKSYFEDKSVRVYTEVTETSLTKIPNDLSEFDNNTVSDNMIFIDAGTVSEEKYKKFLSDYKAWITEHKLYSNNQIILFKEGYINKLTRYQYSDYLSSEYCILREDCNLTGYNYK